ncbi:Hypothetical protein AA314_00312 [Archangium gephyra]|uniref:Uncharacterized protein n=1 Tax=Archangium gephyra TaxID=48 RepID=A0AAC8Q0J1_9BACT|nr:Hypothetical protein AA314_00312 [Archangium gephyra]
MASRQPPARARALYQAPAPTPQGPRLPDPGCSNWSDCRTSCSGARPEACSARFSTTCPTVGQLRTARAREVLGEVFHNLSNCWTSSHGSRPGGARPRVMNTDSGTLTPSLSRGERGYWARGGLRVGLW